MTYKPPYVPRKHVKTADEKNQMDNLLAGIRKVRETATTKTIEENHNENHNG